MKSFTDNTEVKIFCPNYKIAVGWMLPKYSKPDRSGLKVMKISITDED